MEKTNNQVREAVLAAAGTAVALEAAMTDSGIAGDSQAAALVARLHEQLQAALKSLS